MTHDHVSLFNAGIEERLLSWLCSLGLSHRVTLLPMNAEGVDWRRFAVLARHHDVVPLLWRNMHARPDFDVPAWVIRDFREAHRENALKSLRMTSDLVRTIKALAAENIPAVPLKGVCVAARYYHDIASRQTGDIDLLVDPAHLSRANQILRQLGYLRVSNKTHTVVQEPIAENLNFVYHFAYVSAQGIPLELHFALHPNPQLLPVDVADIVAEGISVRIGRVSLPTLPDALQFLFLATHGARHTWQRLKWVCDIAVMVDLASCEEVRQWLALAARYGLTNPAVQALIIAERLLGIPVPLEVTSVHVRSRRIRYMVRRAEHTVFRNPDEAPDEAPGRLNLGLRFYRMCVTSRPGYLWQELRRGVEAFWARLLKLDQFGS